MFTQRREVGTLHIVYMADRCTICCVLTFDQPSTVSLVDLVIVVACCSLLRDLSVPASGGCEGTSEGGVLLAEGGPLRLTQVFRSLEACGTCDAEGNGGLRSLTRKVKPRARSAQVIITTNTLGPGLRAP
jgi:hypothetical protein